MRDHGLARLEVELSAVQVDVDLVRLEVEQVAHPRHLRPRVGVRPRGSLAHSDGVVAGQSLVAMTNSFLSGVTLKIDGGEPLT